MVEQNKSDINSARLFQAVCLGEDVITILSLMQHVDIDVRDSEGNTPLLLAAIHNEKVIFKLFMDFDANINICNRDGCTVLHYASRNGWGKIVRSLVTEVQDLDASDVKGDTAMHYASSSGHPEIVHCLVNEGADCETKNLAGYTPLLSAIEESKYDVFNLLRNLGATIDDSNGPLLLYYAVQNGWQNTVQYLLNRVPDLNKTFRIDETTFYPSSYKHLELLKLLVEDGTGINPIKEMICQAALYYASCMGHFEVLKWLIKEVPGFRVMGHCGDKPLLAASTNGHLESVKFLLEAGSNVYARGRICETALHGASMNGHLEIVKCLLEGGIDIDARTNRGRTALHRASMDGHLEVVKCLVNKGSDIDAECVGGGTPLLYATKYYFKDVVALLIDLGANVNKSVSSSCYTILHCATENMWIDIVKSLLKRGCEVDRQDCYGGTALKVACRLRQIDIAQVLLEAGASWDIEDEDGKSPFNYLFMEEEPDINLIQLFIENGAYFKPTDYDVIVKSSLLEVLQDVKLCCQAIINKFNSYDLPELYKVLASESLPDIAKMKVKSNSEVARTIGQTVGFEIQTKGHCNILEVRPIALSVFSVESVLKYSKKSDLNFQLKRPASSDFVNNSQHSSKSMRLR